MSEGEIPNWKARRLDITEDIYYEIIRKKRQRLFIAASLRSAKSVIEDVVQVEKHANLETHRNGFSDDLLIIQEMPLGNQQGLTSKNKKWLCPYSCLEYLYQRENMAYQFH
jgi:octaprenyl-diphosphate synthase